MAERQDALVTAADIIQKTSALASEIARDENQHFVATIGTRTVWANGAAIVPGRGEVRLRARAVDERARAVGSSVEGVRDVTRREEHVAGSTTTT